MIVLPEDPAPNAVSVKLISYAIKLRPASGAAVQVIDRPGSRFRLEVGYASMTEARGGAFKAALIAAQRQGLRMRVPLQGRSQGNPGAPVVAGANPTGTSLPLRGLVPGYSLKAGFWLTLVDASGDYYLHMAVTTATANPLGECIATIEPPIRAPLADGAAVLLARPMVQGFLSDDTSWNLQVGRLTDGIGFALEEAA